MIVVTGGARSGKSAFAESLIRDKDTVLYIATAIAFDEEMELRIQKHKQRRPQNWNTYEGYIDIHKAVSDSQGKYQTIILDCVTIMITNLLFHYAGTEDIECVDFNQIERLILEQIQRLLEACKAVNNECILVTNEIGLGIVPEHKLSRQFRDIAGKVNQLMADYADDVYFVVSGIPMHIKGANI